MGKNRRKWSSFQPNSGPPKTPKGPTLYSGMGQALGGEEAAAPAPTGDAPAGLRRQRESGDGDCLFHAIARQALGDTHLAGQAREEICNWMEQHLPPSAAKSGRSALLETHRAMVWQQRPEILSCGSYDDAPVLEYVRKMRRRGEWGTGVEALSAAYCYGQAVHVWSPDGFSELLPPSSVRKGASEPIRLLHNGRNHWDSGLPTAGGSEGQKASSSRAAAAAEKEEEEDTPVVTFPATCDQDERAARRAAAAAAAERRGEAAAQRGLGAPKARPALKRPEPRPKVQEAAAAPAEAAAPAAPAASSASADAAGAGNRWARARAARESAAASAAQESPESEGILISGAGTSQGSAALEEGVEALCRVGMSRAEALEALVQNGGDLAQVKALYCIDWDSSGRTLQLPFSS